MKYLKILLLLSLGMFIVSCNKSDSTVQPFPTLPYSYVAPIDEAKIQDFFDKYHMDVDVDYNVSFKELAAPGNGALQSIRTQYGGQLVTRTVEMSGVPHKVYYIPFRSGHSTLKPTLADSVYVCYRGRRLDLPGSSFDNHETSPVWFGGMRNLVPGWGQVVPFFGTCTSPITQNTDGTYNYNGYGAGVMFLPSALGYYNASVGSDANNNYIPIYSPLIFSFKLMALNYTDEDYDRIDSKDEMAFDVATGLWVDKNTDGDRGYDAFDVDDDDDGYLTKYEIKRPGGGYYPFNGELVDDPATPLPLDERQGIPDCTYNYISPSRIRKHLDKNCH